MISLNQFAAGAIIVGALLFLFLYHGWTRRFSTSERVAAEGVPWYEVVDWYLKGSTVAFALAGLLTDWPWLLELFRSPAAVVAGGGIAVGGLALFVAAIRTLGASFSPAHKPLLPETIVRRGPYRWIRHPIYTANILIIGGLFVMTGCLWILLNWVILFTWYVPTVRREERALSDRFEEYRQYVRGTGRFFPRLFN